MNITIHGWGNNWWNFDTMQILSLLCHDVSMQGRRDITGTSQCLYVDAYLHLFQIWAFFSALKSYSIRLSYTRSYFFLQFKISKCYSCWFYKCNVKWRYLPIIQYILAGLSDWSTLLRAERLTRKLIYWRIIGHKILLKRTLIFIC